MLVPDFGQQRTAGLAQSISSLFGSLAASAALNGFVYEASLAPVMTYQSITFCSSARA
jgi:hypothetical protein